MKADLAGLLLLVAVTRHYGWALAAPDLAGVASKGLGALACLALLALLIRSFDSLPAKAAAGWWAINEAMTATCAGAWMLSPWHVPTGYPMCSAWVGIDLGLIAAVFVAVIALSVSIYSSTNSKGSHNERAPASNDHR